MRAFRDNEGREWTFRIHVAAVKACRDLVKVDLSGLMGDGFAGIDKLLADPVQLVDVIYVLCRDEANARGVSDEDFGRALWGDAIDRATDAFLEELADFFPDPRTREALRMVIEKGRAVREVTMDHNLKVLETIDPAAEARRLIEKSTAMPPSSGSTPGRSRSASSRDGRRNGPATTGTTPRPSSGSSPR